MFTRFLLLVTVVFLLLSSCGDSYVPKPEGYYRIDFPAKKYREVDTLLPFTFEIPQYAKIFPDTTPLAEPYWINIAYAPYHAQLHISYKKIQGNLKTYLDDAHTLVRKHIPKANAIGQQEYLNPSEKVYGLIFTISGTEAASPLQFYLTDSTSNFVRGALYFDLVPNNDSLAPVIGFLEQDIRHMISTFRWKKK
ncbi:MAG TPA: gliding motility lipoprotein GldD [Bacteroidales bacterium]|nr:gliding motility lipoprotein GldD [Bacteroidales bacterium]